MEFVCLAAKTIHKMARGNKNRLMLERNGNMMSSETLPELGEVLLSILP